MQSGFSSPTKSAGVVSDDLLPVRSRRTLAQPARCNPLPGQVHRQWVAGETDVFAVSCAGADGWRALRRSVRKPGPSLSTEEFASAARSHKQSVAIASLYGSTGEVRRVRLPVIVTASDEGRPAGHTAADEPHKREPERVDPLTQYGTALELREKHRQKKLKRMHNECRQVTTYLPLTATRMQATPRRRARRRVEGTRRGDTEFDSDEEHLDNSLTLPTIEAILNEEGINSQSISQHIDKLKSDSRRHCQRKVVWRSKKNQYDRLEPIRTGGAPPHKPAHNPPTPTSSTPLSAPGGRALLGEKSMVDTGCFGIRQYVADFTSEIDRLRWLGGQQLEQTAMGQHFVAPRVALVSNNIAGSCQLVEQAVHRCRSIITIHYDFNAATFESIIDDIRHGLNEHRKDCRARSILFFCQGGPGYMYIMKNKVVTPQKIRKRTELQNFWKHLSCLMTRLEEKQTTFHFASNHLLASQQGHDLLSEISDLMYPNIVQLEAVDVAAESGESSLDLYFKRDEYEAWRDVYVDSTQSIR